MNKNIQHMIDNVANGDMAAAGDAFMAAADARRGEAWEQARIDYAQNAFKEVDLGQVTSGIDTGITGHPDEVDEALSGVDQATMAAAKGDIAKSKAILKNRAKAKAKAKAAPAKEK